MRGFLRDVTRSVSSIASHAERGRQGALLATYLRLRLLFAVANSVPGLRFETARLFGYSVNFSHPERLFVPFDEIFVRQVYRFASDAERPLILDCGANIGLATLYFKRLYPDAEIVAFEPDPQAFESLERNLTVNGIRNVRLVNKALAATDGATTLFVDPDHSLAASVSPGRGRGDSTQVETIRLSVFVDREVDFLKLDVEGSEAAVLAELAASGALARIHTMAIEYHHHLPDVRDRLAEVLALLETNGFGYQLAASGRNVIGEGRFQDILIRAYREASSLSAPGGSKIISSITSPVIAGR
jgi:FkbM family methyltransferase